MNYLITLKYDGSSYHGWQRQENAVTVQQRVEEAVSSLFCESVTVYGCSRTDTGVHANCFKCNFHSDRLLAHENVITGLNHFLPPDIAVTDSCFVRDDFNARFNCVSKEYIYKIYNGPIRDPFYNGRAAFYKYPLDEKMLDREASDYIGTHDFSAFRAVGSNVTTTVRTIHHASVSRDGDVIIFTVEGDGFLYNMVRIMVGTLIYISEGKIERGAIPSIILSKDRKKAGKTEVPEGLYLNKVNYESGWIYDGKNE